MSGSDEPRLLYVEHVPADHGQALYDAAIAAGCEGIVSKRANARYRAGDTHNWLKIKPSEVRSARPTRFAQVSSALRAGAVSSHSGPLHNHGQEAGSPAAN